MNRQWKLPLATPPELLMMGISAHQPQPDYDCYRLRNLWCLHFYRYSGELRINGESFAIRPGYCSVTPPDALLEYCYHQSPSVHAVAHFQLAAKASGELLALSAMRDLGRDFESLASLFEAAVGWRSTQTARARARVWDILWRLGALENCDQNASTPPPHAAIEPARQEIEMRLSTPLRVEEIAARAGFSQNHFTRLFFAATGSTPSQYIRARRVERALHLLRNSTLPVKAIAVQCGLGDVQAFNKIMRHEHNMSPRELRQGPQPNGASRNMLKPLVSNKIR